MRERKDSRSGTLNFLKVVIYLTVIHLVLILCSRCSSDFCDFHIVTVFLNNECKSFMRMFSVLHKRIGFPLIQTRHMLTGASES